MQNRYCDITLSETEGTTIICCLVMHEFTIKKCMNKSNFQLFLLQSNLHIQKITKTKKISMKILNQCNVNHK